MSFLNISSDKIYLSDGTRQELLDRNGIENIFGPLLINWQKSSPLHDLLVLNGPGGFTNLRVGSLILNTWNALGEEKIQMWDVDKLSLYAHLVREGFLPHHGIIYLGQKHNVWLVDFAKDPSDEGYCTTITQHQLPAGDYFLDEVYDTAYRLTGLQNMVHLTWKEGKLHVVYQDKTHELTPQSLQLQATYHIEANYMIQPVMN